MVLTGDSTQVHNWGEKVTFSPPHSHNPVWTPPDCSECPRIARKVQENPGAVVSHNRWLHQLLLVAENGAFPHQLLVGARMGEQPAPNGPFSLSADLKSRVAICLKCSLQLPKMILFWLPGLGGPRGPRDAPRSIPGVGMTSGTSVASGGSPGPVAGGLAPEKRSLFFAQATQCGPRVQARVGGQTLGKS